MGTQSRYEHHDKSLRVVDLDSGLLPFEGDLRMRMDRYYRVRHSLVGDEPLKDFANGYKYYGFHRFPGGWVYREWAPAAEALYLVGDFNDWNPRSHPLTRLDDGNWEICLEGNDALTHESNVKVRVKAFGSERDKLPLYIHRAVQNKETNDFVGRIWAPEKEYQWHDEGFTVGKNYAPYIYETHVGMAQEKRDIGTYEEFRDITLPHIAEQGYNTVQIMAIMQHPYYGSFGYHVGSFFAASSWFGTPDELKSLVDKAHSLGIAVLIDIVHSHAVKNISEGINEFDGTDYQFFHGGEKGNHPAWDSKIFDYSKHEVIHFLLSNVKYWMEEYHFDGFRFDGVTSMIYHDHGLGTAFDDYGKYFSMNTDVDAICYLQLANELIKEINPYAISVAEDMSGMPGMCLPVEDGGIGFDYRLSMGMPDFWIRVLKERDEDWNMYEMWHELSTARPMEKRIGYAESHDQALVGDKTLIFRMADQEMYWHMNKDGQSMVIDRAIALHKMMRWATLSMGSEGYLNFMGNEFGHPEWIDFPREGNNWSFEYCRRQWSLINADYLRYDDMNNFDKAMIHFSEKHRILQAGAPILLWIDQDRKLIAFRKEELIFVFNFHPTNSYDGLQLPIHQRGDFKVVLDTDEVRFGGYGRISHEIAYQSGELPQFEDYDGLTLYVPARTAMVLEKMKD